MSDERKPYRCWPVWMAFRKDGHPVIGGTWGSSQRHVVIMESETFKRLVAENSQLATAKFEMAVERER